MTKGPLPPLALYDQYILEFKKNKLINKQNLVFHGVLVILRVMQLIILHECIRIEQMHLTAFALCSQKSLFGSHLVFKSFLFWTWWLYSITIVLYNKYSLFLNELILCIMIQQFLIEIGTRLKSWFFNFCFSAYFLLKIFAQSSVRFYIIFLL